MLITLHIGLFIRHHIAFISAFFIFRKFIFEFFAEPVSRNMDLTLTSHG